MSFLILYTYPLEPGAKPGHLPTGRYFSKGLVRIKQLPLSLKVDLYMLPV